MKLTVDSSEPLEDALRVVGALYGVTLTVSDDGLPAVKQDRVRATARKRRSATTKLPRRASAPDTGAGTSATARSAGPAGAPSNKDVRSWARRKGLNVSERGRVPASLMTAYQDAHQ